MKRCKVPLLRCFLTVALLCAATAPAAALEADGLSAADFVRLIRDFSEAGGYFLSDNFTSSEDSYLTIVDKMKELGATGGAYIGVGPEQNFTYIAKVRPRIAFIVDIRRQAMIQHLMYKAIFQLSPTRADFLSHLLSRPMSSAKAPGAQAPLDEILEFFAGIKADEKTYSENLAAILRTLQEDLQFPLSTEDRESLEYVYRHFFTNGFNVGFDSGMRGGRGFRRMPNLRTLLAKRDLNGKQGNFLAGADDYDFVRGMQRRNLIIPIVGDFAGKKALASVAAYLREHKLTVSVFYVSNVEIVLLDWGSVEQFSDFVKNVKKLPANNQTLLIRSTFSYYGHPASLPGYQFCTFLQTLSGYLRDFNAGRYRSYMDLIQADYIAPDKK
ncbi:MAG: hypothetical protein QUT30_15535 [Acidobacteriota bacterium]|nr:hypothetical protein [Acidobacteriota bacterium]